MPDVGLGSDKSHRCAVANTKAAQVGVHGESRLIGGAEARCPLHRAHDDGAGVGNELLPCLAGNNRVVHVARRLRVSVGAKALDLLESDFGAGGDHQEVIIEERAVAEFNPALRRMHALGSSSRETDTPLFQPFRDRKLDLAVLCPLAAAHGFDGTKCRSGASDTIVTWSPGRASSSIS